MFDVSMSELGMVVLVAILVIKPQDLRDGVRWWRQMREGINSQYHNHRQKFQEEIAGFLGDDVNGNADKRANSYILDMHGKPQETYTLDDIMPFIKNGGGKQQDGPQKK